MALARQPGLVLEHADAYVDLASAELDAGLNSAAALLAVLALGLAGAAGLAVAVVPLGAMPMPWLLAVIPAVPLLLAALLAWRARRLEKSPPFAALRQQMAQDLATLRILDEE
jgi:uncharacterized membrane protein YqjE